MVFQKEKQSPISQSRPFKLMSFFYRNPTQCYDKGPWKTFSSHIGDILVIFQKNKLDHTEKDVQETTGLLQGQWTGRGYTELQGRVQS